MNSIRLEKPTDAAAIKRVLDSAFGRSAEGAAVEALRARRALVLSLAALRADTIVGSILFTDAHLDETLKPKPPDEPDPARPVAPPPARRRSAARRVEPEVQWVSLEEDFERERREREMEEVLEAARSSVKPKATTVTTIVPLSIEAKQVPKFVVLAPVAVLPSLQRRGIGSSLIEAGLAHVARMNAAAVFVLGDPAYYGRFGFISTRPFGIGCEIPVQGGEFQVRELRPGALEGVKGVVRFEPEFRALD